MQGYELQLDTIALHQLRLHWMLEAPLGFDGIEDAPVSFDPRTEWRCDIRNSHAKRMKHPKATYQGCGFAMNSSVTLTSHARRKIAGQPHTQCVGLRLGAQSVLPRSTRVQGEHRF